MLYKFVEPKKRIMSRESAVDSLAYTPLHVQIQRMLDSGVALTEYRRRLNASALYSQEDVSGDDPETPSVIVYNPDPAEAQKVLETVSSKLSQKKTVKEASETEASVSLGSSGVSPEQVAGSDD